MFCDISRFEVHSGSYGAQRWIPEERGGPSRPVGYLRGADPGRVPAGLYAVTDVLALLHYYLFVIMSSLSFIPYRGSPRVITRPRLITAIVLSLAIPLLSRIEIDSASFKSINLIHGTMPLSVSPSAFW